jgi:hypothetical protein
MGRALLLMVAAVMPALPLRAGDEGLSLPKQYLAIYLKINEAEQAERQGDLRGARAAFEECYERLLAIHKADPDWEDALVLHRLDDCKAKVLELTPKADAEPAATNAPSTVAPSLPKFPVDATALATIFIPGRALPHNIYPWKVNVAAVQFWIGENGEKASAWVPDWVGENGGSDNPENRNGYAAGGFASRANPFYVALPFDDLAHPDLAQKWLPHGWARAPRNGKPVSACKDRWVELKNARGTVCYAQWEDAGAKTDEAEYVLGGAAAPKAAGPGIELSPAVATYLGLPGNAMTVAWRFVEDAEVRPGAWMKLDEQALIYKAMDE